MPVVTLGAWERPDSALLETLREAPSGNVSDAAGREVGIPPSIRPLTSAATLCGTALTVDCGRGSNLGVWAALEHVRAGDVLVLATHDERQRAVIGDLLAGYARNAGCAGIVTDGMVRDVEALDAMGLPVFAHGATPVGPSKEGPAAVGLPVTLGGRRIESGDAILGDRDGLVHVPRARLPGMAEALRGIAAREAAMMREIEDGATVPSKAGEVLGTVRLVRPG